MVSDGNDRCTRGLAEGSGCFCLRSAEREEKGRRPVVGGPLEVEIRPDTVFISVLSETLFRIPKI